MRERSAINIEPHHGPGGQGDGHANTFGLEAIVSRSTIALA
jgi:hypothetical protein